MYHFYVQGEGVGRGMPVPATITEQTKFLDLQTKLMVSWLALILYYANSVNIGSINKDDISELLCVSVLFNVTKPI